MGFMPSPWLNIPLQDYEGHMNEPHVAQLDALADLFEETLRKCSPDSVTILGIAGGNGLSRIDGKGVLAGHLPAVAVTAPDR